MKKKPQRAAARLSDSVASDDAELVKPAFSISPCAEQAASDVGVSHLVIPKQQPEFVLERLQTYKAQLLQDIETLRMRWPAVKQNLPLYPQFTTADDYLRSWLLIPMTASKASPQDATTSAWHPFILDYCRTLGVDADAVDRLLRRIVSGDLTDKRAVESNSDQAFDQLDIAIARARQQWLSGEPIILGTPARLQSAGTTEAKQDNDQAADNAEKKPGEIQSEAVSAGDDSGDARNETDDKSVAEPAFVFRKDGDGYYLKGFGEHGHVTAKGAKGLHNLFRLVQSSGVPVLMLELEAGLRVEQWKGDRRSIQPMVDAPGMRKIAEELKRLQADIDSIDPTSPDSKMEREELENRLAQLTAQVTKVRGKNGRIRDLNASDLNRMKSNIWGRINTVCDQIESRLPKLSRHFRDTTGAFEGAFYVYTPSIPDLKWDTTPQMVGRDPTK